MDIQYAPFCEKQSNYIRECLKPNNWLNCAEGGKRAGKNIINIIAWCDILENHPDKLHLAAGVSVATAKLNIIDSNGFGVLNYFKGRCRQGKYQDKDALIIQTITGEKIVLISGGGKNGDERFIKGLTLGSVYISEVNECAQSFVKEVFDRTMSSKQRKILFDLNPKAELHWFYAQVLNIHERNSLKYHNYGYNYEHFTLHDNLSFTDKRIKEIIRTYDKKSIWYQRDILGLRKNAEGLIYSMFDVDNQYEDGKGPDYELYYKRYYTIDYGTINPFACLEIIEQTIQGKSRHYVENEFYYDSKKHNYQKSDAEYADDLKEFIGDKRYSAVIIDPSAASFKAELRKRSLRAKETDELINADNQVLNGIRLTSTLLQIKQLLVNKTKCPNLIKEFGAYIWDSKASERGVEKVVKEMDHLCDALRYYVKTIIKSSRGVK
jgi:PBSX family phage terminase large subunit